MYVYFLESTQAIRMRSDLGLRKPAYCTAEGQAILAFSPPEVVAAAVRTGLQPRTPNTITDADTLARALESVRARGCAVDDEESEVGVRCVAAPVRNDAGEVVAAVGVAGPVSRLSKRSLSAFMPHVVRTADAISARLGHRQ
jgi:DNA-binding IclR family transcriptional regulator